MSGSTSSERVNFFVLMVVIACNLYTCAGSRPDPAPALPAQPVKKAPPVKKKVEMFRYVPPRKKEQAKTDADLVRRQLTQNNSYFSYLYKQHSKLNPDLEGKFAVEIHIDDAGCVTACRVVESSMPDKGLERDIVKFIRQLSFEGLLEGEQTVYYPFVF